MLAAMERALADHMDILNMSIGSAFTWPQYPTAVAADRLVRRHGMVVVASIGNSGASGLYSAGAPGVGEKVIGVASFDNTRISQQGLQVTGIANAIGYSPASAAPPAPTSGTLVLKTLGTTTSTTDGCAAMPAGTYAGLAALIRRGGCTFAVKAANAQGAGASAVILYNNTTGTITPTVAGATPITIPVVMISQADGGALWAQTTSAAGASLTWTVQIVTAPSSTGGLISGFSSSNGSRTSPTSSPSIMNRPRTMRTSAPRSCRVRSSSSFACSAIVLGRASAPREWWARSSARPCPGPSPPAAGTVVRIPGPHPPSACGR